MGAGLASAADRLAAVGQRRTWLVIVMAPYTIVRTPPSAGFLGQYRRARSRGDARRRPRPWLKVLPVLRVRLCTNSTTRWRLEVHQDAGSQVIECKDACSCLSRSDIARRSASTSWVI